MDLVHLRKENTAYFLTGPGLSPATDNHCNNTCQHYVSQAWKLLSYLVQCK
jgi:hypothetical protein